MNIAVFTDTYSPHTNGVTSAINLEAEELIKRGHNVWIITVGRRLNTQEDTVLRIRSLPTIGLNTKQPFRIGIFDRARIDKFLHQKSIDIVHTHTEFMLGWLGYYYAKKHKLPLVHTFHTMWEDYKDIYFLTRAVIPFTLVRTLLKNFLDKPDRIITPTQKSRDYLVSLVPDATIDIIQNGIPFTPLDVEKKLSLRKKYLIDKDSVVALFAGRISDEKRILQLYRAYKFAASQYPELVLYVAGDGARLSDLRKIIHKDGLQSQFRLLGFVPHSTIAELATLSDITTTASLSETSNMSILEGISSGCAVIARNDPCLSGVVKNGINGYLCQDELEMVERILQLCSTPKLLKTIQNTNRTLAPLFSKKTHTTQLIKTYTSVLGEL